MDSSKQPSTDGAHPDTEGSRKNLTGSQTVDVSAATYLDVAVLRCLFITHWQEEGIYWALHYLYNRFLQFTKMLFIMLWQKILLLLLPKKHGTRLPCFYDFMLLYKHLVFRPDCFKMF